MKEQLFFIFILTVFSLSAQNISMLDVEIKDNYGQPLSNTNLYLYDGNTKLSWSFSDEKGNANFLIDSLSFNSDSVYLLINTGITLSSNTKIFINNLKLLESNKIGNISIKITDFKLFTQEEFSAYCKKNGLMPLRKNTLAKDVK